MLLPNQIESKQRKIKRFNLSIRKKTQSIYLLYCIVLLAVFSQGLIDFFHLSQFIKYLIDVFLVLAVIINIPKLNKSRLECRFFVVYIACFFLYTVITYLFHYQSLVYFLWGARNTFRYYLFFLVCIVTLKNEDINRFLSFFKKLFYANALICVIQFFIFGIKQDNLGGIFGSANGCNGSLHIFLSIIITITTLEYIRREIKLRKIATIYAISILIGALAELKFFFVEILIIIILAILVTNFTWRKVALVAVSVLGVSIGISVLVTLFPEWHNSFSFSSLWNAGIDPSGYTGSGDLNRLNAISTLITYYMKGWREILFGLGLGNCDYASFDFLTTPFYKRYAWLHYTWLSSAFVFLETGLIGLSAYFGFFIMVFLKCRKIYKLKTDNRMIIQLGQVLALVSITIAIYNSSLRTEAGYMIYLFLAMPFCEVRKNKIILGS